MSPDPVLARAHALLELSRPEEARALLLPLVGSGSAEPTVWALLAQCDLAMDNAHLALQAADHAVAADPDGEHGHRLRSVALSELKMHGGAVDAARRSVSLAPHLHLAHLQLSQALGGAGEQRDSLVSARRAVELAPHSASAHGALGLALLRQGRLDEAEQAYRRVLEIRPDEPTALNNLGVIEMRRGGHRRAARHFVGSLRSNPRQRLAADNAALTGRLVLNRLLLITSSVVVLVATYWRVAGAVRPADLLILAAVAAGVTLWWVHRLRGLPAGVVRQALRSSGAWRMAVTPLVCLLLTVGILSVRDVAEQAMPVWIFWLLVIASRFGRTRGGR